MTTLIVGGAASGKSAYAERLLCAAGTARRVYLATMRPEGAEALARVERHRAARQGAGFETVECYVNLERAEIPRGGAVLLEDIGNLCANELYGPSGAGDGAAEAILRGVARVREQCGTLVIVSNEVFTGGSDYAGDTLRYLGVLAYANRMLAALADNVCEVACGVPAYYKGEESPMPFRSPLTRPARRYGE